MVIILLIKPQEILETTPLGHKFYECLFTRYKLDLHDLSVLLVDLEFKSNVCQSLT